MNWRSKGWETKLVADVAKARSERERRMSNLAEGRRDRERSKNNYDANLGRADLGPRWLDEQWPRLDEVEDYEEWQWAVAAGDTVMGFRDWLKKEGQ